MIFIPLRGDMCLWRNRISHLATDQGIGGSNPSRHVNLGLKYRENAKRGRGFALFFEWY